MKLIAGQKISSVRTLGTMYDMNCIEGQIEEGYVRIPAKVIATMLNDYIFETVQKRKYLYLEKAIPLEVAQEYMTPDEILDLLKVEKKW